MANRGERVTSRRKANSNEKRDIHTYKRQHTKAGHRNTNKREAAPTGNKKRTETQAHANKRREN